jgi:hypothetical protein
MQGCILQSSLKSIAVVSSPERVVPVIGHVPVAGLPESKVYRWIPAFAGMTQVIVRGMVETSPGILVMYTLTLAAVFCALVGLSPVNSIKKARALPGLLSSQGTTISA